MAISEKTRRALERLGLTGYETKAYLALLDFGAMTASDISRQSGVPYSKIYEALNSLEQKGWVEVEHLRPSRFYPKSPATALETMRIKADSERRRGEEQVLGELTTIYEKRGVKEKPEIWIVRGDFNILSKVKETLSGCEQELMMALPPVSEEFTPLLTPILNELREKGVRTLILTPKSSSGEFLASMNRVGEVRVRDQMFGGGVISDGKEVVLLLGGGDETGDSLAIWAAHAGLAKFAKDYFEHLWTDSESYGSLKKSS